jgi:hypothetical protein
MVGVGLNSPQAFLGSELKDRGDRIAFLGDAHATQPTVLAAFQNYEMLWSSNEHTKGQLLDFGGIQPYWLMWCSSILDLYDATGNTSAFQSFQPYIARARPGQLSALGVSRSKSFFYGAFVWARGALNSQKRRFPVRAGAAL